MIEVVLVRHASAGERAEWQGDDRLRPLDDEGRRQAQALVRALEPLSIARVLSSPYVRCVDTVVPLADARGLAVEPRPELEESRGLEDVLALVDSVGQEPVVLCTHGDVVEAVLGQEGPKGAAWAFERVSGGLRLLEEIAPVP